MPSRFLISPFLICFNKILWLCDHNPRSRISRSVIVAFEAIAVHLCSYKEFGHPNSWHTHVWDCLQTDGLSMCPHCADHSKTESCGHYRTTASRCFVSIIFPTYCTCYKHVTISICQCTNVLNTLGNNISLWEFGIKNACWMVRIHCDAILI